jgi:hypothetical protein
MLVAPYVNEAANKNTIADGLLPHSSDKSRCDSYRVLSYRGSICRCTMYVGVSELSRTSLTIQDYAALAELRHQIRRFVRFSVRIQQFVDGQSFRGPHRYTPQTELRFSSEKHGFGITAF